MPEMNAISSASRARFETRTLGTDGSAMRGRTDGTSAVPACQEHRRESGDPGARRPDHERPGQAEQLDEDEARGQRPQDCADRVRGVQPPEGEAEVRVTGQVTGEDRQRGTHQHGGRRQGQERQHEPHEREQLRR